MGLSAFNRMRAMKLAEEEARKAEEARLASLEEVQEAVVPQVIEEPAPAVAKPKRKKTDAEKLKSRKN